MGGFITSYAPFNPYIQYNNAKMVAFRSDEDAIAAKELLHEAYDDAKIARIGEYLILTP